MKKTYSVYVVGDDLSVSRLFINNGWNVCESMRYADLIQFTGGTDITPSLYNQQPHARTSANATLRDKKEGIIYNLCVAYKKPMAGICRGMQLINALNGGNMWQDVDNHMGNHRVTDSGLYKFSYMANSIHHQQIIPTKDAWVLASANRCTRKEKLDEHGRLDIFKPYQSVDPEVAYWEAINAFGVQWHPEYHCHEQPDLDEIYINYLHDVLLD